MVSSKSDVLRSLCAGYMGAALEKSQGVDRGMFGVFRPIYTVGAALSTKSFLYNAIVMTIVEYYGSCIFDKDKKLWDYSLVPGNFEGRISLTSSVAFALFGKTDRKSVV